MADKETTHALTGSSQPASPAHKRVKATSPPTEEAVDISSAVSAPKESAEILTSDVTSGELSSQEDLLAQADDDSLDSDSDSAIGSLNSDSTSISSSIYAGYLEHGRKYQTKREGEYWGPSDEKQFTSMQAAHIVYAILDHKEPNPLFRSPIPETAQNILDIGTGSGRWAIEVADRYPSALVQGVDLSPPPETWVPTNCRFEVDDVIKPWLFREKFDLIHMRDMQGAFSDEQWRLVYKQAYDNLAPGGWIEEVEAGCDAQSDDGTLLPDSDLNKWSTLLMEAAIVMDRPLDTIDKCKSRIEAAGFTNVQERWYKVPLGEWTRSPTMKEAGKFCKQQLLEGVEGYSIFLLTKYGSPQPWSSEEVQVLLAKVRKDIETPGLHAYYLKRRVWGQKPLDK